MAVSVVGAATADTEHVHKEVHKTETINFLIEASCQHGSNARITLHTAEMRQLEHSRRLPMVSKVTL